MILEIPWHATYHFTLFFPTIMMEIRTFHFWIHWSKGGNLSIVIVNFRGPMKLDLCLLISPWHVTYHFTGFFLTKTMETKSKQWLVNHKNYKPIQPLSQQHCTSIHLFDRSVTYIYTVEQCKLEKLSRGHVPNPE